MRPWFVLLVASSALPAASCSASPELASSPDADRIFEVKCDPRPATTGGATFGELYTELLSATGVAGCQDSTCHGGSTGAGGLSMGTDKNGAYEGLKALAQINPTATTTDDPPATVRGLFNVVRPLSNGAPRMPKPLPLCANRALNGAELERIKAWGRAGAKND